MIVMKRRFKHFSLFLSGRGRASDARMINLTYIDSGHAEREAENARAIELTNQALDLIQRECPESLRAQVIVIFIKMSG